MEKKLDKVEVTAELHGGFGRLLSLPPNEPESFLSAARSFHVGAAALSNEKHATLAFGLLAGQCAECVLKAMLATKVAAKELRSQRLGHDLGALWNLAHAHGFLSASAHPTWLDVLAVGHKGTPGHEYVNRYLTNVHGFITPAPEPMLTELGSLLQLASQVIADWFPGYLKLLEAQRATAKGSPQGP